MRGTVRATSGFLNDAFVPVNLYPTSRLQGRAIMAAARDADHRRPDNLPCRRGCGLGRVRPFGRRSGDSERPSGLRVESEDELLELR
jgi:hypothetical protein